MEASNMHASIHRYLDFQSEDQTKEGTRLLEQKKVVLDDFQRLQKSVYTIFHVLDHISR